MRNSKKEVKRLTLEQFKSSISKEDQENLEQLAGGILGFCHVSEMPD